jgi:glycosyltransferase involved in cell wall biosynthesis
MLKPRQAQSINILQTKRDSDRRILLFELGLGGHRGALIQHILRYWSEQNLPGHLDIVVHPRFCQQHQDVVEIAKTCDERVNIVPITEEEETALGPWSNFIFSKQRSLREWSLLSRYASKLGATECLVMFFDNFQLSTVLRRQLPCPFSGIYFRARFHYGDFENKLFWKDYIRQWIERHHIAQTLRHPQFKTLYCLDEFAIKHLSQFHSHAQVVYLPDPIQLYPFNNSEVDALRRRLKITPERQVFLLFGAIDERKGIYQLLKAIELLPPTLYQKMCLLLIGKISANEKPKIEAQITKISQLLPIQIIANNQYVPEREIHLYFEIADVVLTPHQRHVGTSNNLIRAAAAQTAVISADYGQMGEWVRSYQLGLTVDSTIPSEIAKGITRFLTEPPAKFCDRAKMKYFVDQHSAEEFASTIFKNL